MPLIFPTAPPTLANFVGAVSCRAISSLLSRPRQLPPLGPAQPHQCRPIAVVVAVAVEEAAAAAVVTATGRRMKIILSRPALTYQSRSCRYCCSNVARLKSTTAATGYGITPNSSNSNSSTIIIISSITSPTTSRSTTSTQTTRPRRQNGRRWQAALRTTRAHLTACVCRCRSHRSKRQTHIMSWTNKISPFISTTHE